MTHIVTEGCIKCKYTDCVEVCPVSCFHEGKDMLVIDPLVCIDCGVCIQECPINAIVAESQDQIYWLEVNRKYSQVWPQIKISKLPPEDADQYAQIKDKRHLLTE